METANSTPVRRKITPDFVAWLAGTNPLTVRYCIRNEIFPYSEFAQAYVIEGNVHTSYSISKEALKKYFPFTEDDVHQFYVVQRRKFR